jgi:glycerol uptake facilitator-like aquaporin
MGDTTFRNIIVEGFGAYCLMYLRLSGMGGGGVFSLAERSL